MLALYKMMFGYAASDDPIPMWLISATVEVIPLTCHTIFTSLTRNVNGFE
jgi:hypothetical protein